ncbi:phage portal protein [Adlercreutzia sp. ZJ176]|uniref:phage portal protein n=2 Tax=unclassified Adlercreutzia TaxID=2636013 RepID=UPI0013EBF7B2|nr:phage portal protein [Adlercreutzia sp. ZJ176]
MVNITDYIRFPFMTDYESRLLIACVDKWRSVAARNDELTERYDGNFKVKNLGIAIPPEVAKLINMPLMMWSQQAVDRVVNGSVIDGYKFSGSAPSGFLEAMDRNHFIEKYDETLPSLGTHGVAFATATKGTDGEPDFVISTYDANHAGVLWDYRQDRELCGIVIVDIDVTTDVLVPTVVNFHTPCGDIVEVDATGDTVKTRRIKCGTGRPCIVAFRNNPDKRHPLGKSMITKAIKDIEDEANRTALRLVVASEVYTYPTKYISGANEDVLGADAKVALNKWLALPPIDEDGNIPTVGQLNGQDLQPLINYERQLANQFAAEASIPIHSLLYTEANPASAEAMDASRHDLVEKIDRLNRLAGATIKKLALLCMSIQQEVPVELLGDTERTFSVQWKNPTLPSLAASADAAQKLASTVEGFAGTPTYWHMLGYNDSQITDIMAEIKENKERGGDRLPAGFVG